ncbi:related to Dor1-like family protein [Cephalotrichum gorgonifer]|uniref:Mitochondrial glycine transporter n=1 Tax=Cephalotrichum gorgonifer TaxID=2041049 RepID=A0AAE8MQT7_9PEZI|nr:related to Dor1-like family protein [Cephalotrichum gorgonifer]
MADSLLETLGLSADDETHTYLAHLGGLTTASLDKEAASLAQSSQSIHVALQALSKKSHAPIIRAVTQHDVLRQSLPTLGREAAKLRSSIPKIDSEVVRFSTAFSKSSQCAITAKRRRDLLLLQNVERLVDVLEVPTLLETAVTSGPANHSSALDLNGHIRRLHSLYPDSKLISSVAEEADSLIYQLALDLVHSLGTPGLKLASAIRTASLLRRVLPDILPSTTKDAQEKTLGLVFLLRRTATLALMLDALEPLRNLADSEKANVKSAGKSGSWSGGQHTERYLKRYVEVFREHSFAIISMFRSVFVSQAAEPTDPLQPVPQGLSTLVLHLVDMLLEPLDDYLPVIKDQSSRDSILTQVLYCAGSLGRLGGDFGLLLFGIGPREGALEAEHEWVEVARRHRFLTGRLASGVGSAVLLQPLDLLKTRAQQPNHTSLATTLRQMLRSPLGRATPWTLWRGTVPSALRTGFGSALYFTLLNSLRHRALRFEPLRDVSSKAGYSSQLPTLSNMANLATGATARVMAGMALMPLTIIKVRFESSKYSYGTMWAAARDIHRTGGFRGFFAGFGATAIRDGPYAGTYVLLYESLKKRLSRISVAARGESGQAGSRDAAAINFTSAIVAGGACSILSNPFDAIKTRIQLEPNAYANMMQACRTMVRSEGVRSLFDGLALRMTRKALSSALAWTAYEELIRIGGVTR